MQGYMSVWTTSLPGIPELIILASCFLIPTVVAVAVIVIAVKLAKSPPTNPTVTCGKCAHPNPTTSRFRSQCGQSLQNAAP